MDAWEVSNPEHRIIGQVDDDLFDAELPNHPEDLAPYFEELREMLI